MTAGGRTGRIGTTRAQIDVMIIAYNEALNLPRTLRALHGWANRVFVVDSGSTDGTAEIARSAGAEVVSHEWEGYARQKNWALDNLPFESDWILILDADEVLTEGLRQRLFEIAARPVRDVSDNGYFINRLTYFLDHPIRHCGFFPNWNLRFLKRGHGRYEDREVHEHVMMEPPIGYIREPMIHDDQRGLEHYYAKHNRYSTLEARSIHRELTQGTSAGRMANLPGDARRRRWLKHHIMPHVPVPSLWRFLYMYVGRLGVLDGWVGLEFCRFIASYDAMVALKLRELRRQARAQATPGAVQDADEPAVSALAVAEGGEQVLPDRRHTTEASSGGAPDGHAQMQPEPSPWTFKEKVGRAIWMVFGKTVFRMSFHNWYRFRAALLRLFGARIGTGVAIRPTANIEVPWMLDIEDDASVGDHAILYSLGTIHIGRRAIISQFAHLCAGTHDHTDHTFRLIRTPVTIGDDVWIGADAFIGPGVTVGPLSVVGARSSTYKDLPARKVYVGNPARPIKDRVLR